MSIPIASRVDMRNDLQEVSHGSRIVLTDIAIWCSLAARTMRNIAIAIACGVVVFGLAHTRGQAQTVPAQAPSITVTLVGTAPGPPVRVGRTGISTLVEAGGERFLFDAGYGSLEGLVASGLPMDAVTRLFLTHLHSDHIVD